MSREIKFRVWDTKAKVMVVEGFHVIGEVTAMGGIEEHIAENRCGATSSIERWNDMELMQFTGLLDRNGKEIYEGDVIVSDSYPFFNEGVPGYVGVVEWEYAAWYYTLQCVNSNLVGSAIGDQLGANGNDATRFRVIGNIHQQPELLK